MKELTYCSYCYIVYVFTAIMDADNKELSTEFYKCVCNIIGSEKVVKKRREIFTSLDCLFTNSKFLYISSGSSAEGLNLKGSDIDQMYCRNDILVYEDDSKLFTSNKSMPNFIMDTNATKPGFTLLRSDTAINLPYLKDLFHDKYLSSKAFREDYREKVAASTNLVDFVIHGPCISDGEFYDYASCFR